MRKRLCIILAAALLFNMADVSTIKAKSISLQKNESTLSAEKGKGYKKPSIQIFKSATSSSPRLKSTNLPSSYDLRTQGYLTSVKDQGQINDCWAFSTMSSLESCLLKSQYGKEDFSEINLAVNSGFAGSIDDGGNSLMSTAYFARWGGPVSEADDPNPYPAQDSNVVVRSGLKPEAHVQDVIFLPNRTSSTDNNAIKTAVMSYGAVATTICMDTTYLNSANNAYYYNGSNLQDHGINIVGWDDNYSKSNFLNTPVGDGAFICKNSWGDTWGDNGYFYVSYYDTGIGTDNYVFDNAEPVNNYSEEYQYTPLGVGGWSSYGNTNWFSNVYTATDEGANKQSLSAVSFYTYEDGTSYEIYAEPDYTTYGFNRISSSAKLKYGTFSNAGYHTVKLDNPINLTSGKKFAIAVRITNSSETHVITESTDFKDTSTVISSDGQSYISGDYNGNPYNWNGIAAGKPNVCLNAFTKITYSVPVTGISLNSSSLNLNPGDTSTLTASISPSNAIDKNVIFSSSDDYIASVDSTGKVAAKSAGYAVITAMSEDGSFKAQCTVNVKGNITYNITSPTANTDVDVNSSIVMNFSNNIKAGSAYSNIALVDEDGNNAAVTTTINNNILTIKPGTALSQNKIYILKFPVNAVTDYAGNTIAGNVSCSFLTKLPYNDNVAFDSPCLEKQIRSQLNKSTGNITSDDMKALTSINISDENISSLKGLEYAIYLDNLDMYKCNIKDISPLKHMLNLSTLSLTDNYIQDISPLRYLYNVQNIYLRNNFIEDCSVLEDKTNIHGLYLSENNISDITPIKNMIMNQKNMQKSVTGSIDVEFNYLNTSDPGTSSSIDYIKNSINTFYSDYQRSGIKLLYASPDDEFIDKSIAPVVITFKDAISSGAELNSIQFYDNNGQLIACDISVNGNKLIVRPKQKLTSGTSYYVDIPQNAVTASTGTGNDECYYSFTADSYSYDINKDGTTDIKDIAALSQSYGQKATDSSFNSTMDYNKDGIIDVYDLTMASRKIN